MLPCIHFSLSVRAKIVRVEAVGDEFIFVDAEVDGSGVLVPSRPNLKIMELLEDVFHNVVDDGYRGILRDVVPDELMAALVSAADF